MDIDDVINQPEDGVVLVTSKGTVICSAKTLMEWTDGAANIDALRRCLEDSHETLRGHNET